MSGRDENATLRVRIDPARCQGQTRCNFVAPAMFEIDEKGNGYVRGDGVLRTDEELALAKRGAASCPESAIFVDTID